MTFGRALDALQLDALREVASIGAGHAATALSDMIGRPVRITVPRVRCYPMDELLAEASGPRYAAVTMAIVGDVSGRTLFLLETAGARALCEVLLARPASGTEAPLDEMEVSALKELANIVTGAYAGALGSFLGVLLLPSVPDLAVGRLADVLPPVEPRRSKPALCVETRFRVGGELEVGGHLVLIPDPAAVRALLRALRLHA